MSNLITRFRRILMGDEAELEIGIMPTGTKSITENGTYDVTEYASAEVDVSIAGNIPEITTITKGATIRNYTEQDLVVEGGLGHRQLLIAKNTSADVLTYEATTISAKTYTTKVYFPFYPENSIGYAYAIGLIRMPNSYDNLPSLNITATGNDCVVRTVNLDEKKIMLYAWYSTASTNFGSITINIQAAGK